MRTVCSWPRFRIRIARDGTSLSTGKSDDAGLGGATATSRHFHIVRPRCNLPPEGQYNLPWLCTRRHARDTLVALGYSRRYSSPYKYTRHSCEPAPVPYRGSQCMTVRTPGYGNRGVQKGEVKRQPDIRCRPSTDPMRKSAAGAPALGVGPCVWRHDGQRRRLLAYLGSAKDSCPCGFRVPGCSHLSWEPRCNTSHIRPARV